MKRVSPLTNIFIAIVVMAIPGSVMASDGDSGGPAGFERERVYTVPIQGESSSFEVERIVVNVGDRLVGVSARAGVVRESQHRIRLRGLPVVGQIFSDRLTRSDFTPDQEVGDVFAEDRALFVDLSRGRPGLWFETLVLVHDRFSYRFQGGIASGVAGPRGDPRAVGKAYARGDTLVLLVRPSIITDSGF